MPVGSTGASNSGLRRLREAALKDEKGTMLGALKTIATL
ncbi:hypothetical protein C7441_1111 [Pseudaminobacter salicylatoxidans]|uniref:Uncharacterized protein n=1 Tax=Pseudaminobacter salicylatoxidans TaxID=93369 RepID=A0A316BZW0_PSESE|nr:hypothetical protein C7441_1111 [Pseudaminobacter salicylatoxidans]